MKSVEAVKVRMTQSFREDGRVIPVTEVSFPDFPQDLTSGSEVTVTGTSKGKGFAGVMKRHGFSGLPATHGASTKVRAPGSIGGTTTPGRVYKGKKMAGRMGGERVTVKGLAVIEVDPEAKTARISGAIPGPNRSVFTLRYEPAEEVVREEQPEGSEAAEESKEEKNES